MSTRPTVERCSCRCVPSAQSKSSRSPPRRTRNAAGARCAVGIDADVPRKTRSRSTDAMVGAADARGTVVRMGTTEDPRPAAVTFLTTEHFTLQGSRAATIAESTGRATMFLSSVSGGLVALGLVAAATDVGDAFFAFGLVLLPLLAFLG